MILPHAEEHYSKLYGRMEEEHRQRIEQRKAAAERVAKLEDGFRAGLRAPAGTRPPIWKEGDDR